MEKEFTHGDLVCSDGVVNLSCMAALLHGGDYACLEDDSLNKGSGATVDELVRVAQEAGFSLQETESSLLQAGFTLVPGASDHPQEA